MLDASSNLASPAKFIRMKKNIKDLTENEAKEIFEFSIDDKDCYFEGVSHESAVDEDGSRRVTLEMRPIIGIKYRNHSGDGCILHFDNTRVVLWLYRNGYDIEEQLECNKDLSKIETDLENLSFSIYWHCNENNKHSLESLKKQMLESIDKYYYNS